MAAQPPTFQPPTRRSLPPPQGQSRPSQQSRPQTPTGPIGFTIILLCFIIVALDRTKLIPVIHPVATTLYQWFILLSAFGIVLGVINVFILHLQRVLNGQPEWGLSLTLLATDLATLVAGLIQRAGVAGPFVEWLYDVILAPGGATLYALLFFSLAAALYRFLRVTAPGGKWMVAGALTMLVIQMPASANLLPTAAVETMMWLLQTPVMATIRGALLGSALALLIVGARYLLGRSQ